MRTILTTDQGSKKVLFPLKKIDVIMEWSQSIYNVAKRIRYLRCKSIMASALGKKNNEDERFNKKGIKDRPGKILSVSLGFVVIMSFLVSAC